MTIEQAMAEMRTIYPKSMVSVSMHHNEVAWSLGKPTTIWTVAALPGPTHQGKSLYAAMSLARAAVAADAMTAGAVEDARLAEAVAGGGKGEDHIADAGKMVAPERGAERGEG